MKNGSINNMESGSQFANISNIHSVMRRIPILWDIGGLVRHHPMLDTWQRLGHSAVDVGIAMVD